MRKNIQAVVDAFINRQSYTSKTLSCVAEWGFATIYSYDMPIATIRGDGKLEIIAREKGPTATTRGHISQVGRCLEGNGYDYAKEMQCLTDYPEHKFCDRAGQDGYLSRGGFPPLSNGKTGFTPAQQLPPPVYSGPPKLSIVR